MTARCAPGLSGNVIPKVVRLEGLIKFDSATLLLQALPIPFQMEGRVGFRGIGVGWNFMTPLRGNPMAIREFTSIHRDDVLFSVSSEADDENRYQRAQQVYQQCVLNVQPDADDNSNSGSNRGSIGNGYDVGNGVGFGSADSTKSNYDLESSGYAIAENSSKEYHFSEDNVSEHKSVRDTTMPPRNVNVHNDQQNAAAVRPPLHQPQLPPPQPASTLDRDYPNKFSHLSLPALLSTSGAAVARSRATLWIRQPLLDLWQGISSPNTNLLLL